MYELAKEAAEENPRLREPLFLYAVFSDKTDVLLRASKTPELKSEFGRMTGLYNKTTLEEALSSVTSPLPDRYKKVWNSYLSKKNRLQNDNHTKALMRSKVVRLQQAKDVSNYRLYEDLGVNPGNFNAWLKYGDPSKVSLDTAPPSREISGEYPTN